MEAPLMAADDTARFFLADAVRRLTRLAELSLAYGGFLLLLYCRVTCPGGADAWRWAESTATWALVFLPLFLLDWRNYLFYKYLCEHYQRFQPQDGRKYFLICVSEFAYKVLLCVHLSCKFLRPYVTVKVSMFVYAIGYVVHFVVGHFAPIEDGDRPEGCNVVGSLLSDLGRFLSFVLVVSLSLKVYGDAEVAYDWQAAFWPCWGLEGIIMLVVASLLPAFLIAVVLDRPRALMLVWVLVFGVAFGVVSFVSMYNVAALLDGKYCSSDMCAISNNQCRQALDLSFWPWLALLPTFAGTTLLLRRHLAAALHFAWYQPGRLPEDLESRGVVMPPTPQQPLPTLMFRITATYYSRTWDIVMLHGSIEAAAAADVSASIGPHGPVDRSAVASGAMAQLGSLHSVGALHHRSALGAVDPSTSILSARGATFADIVESEQLCFVCYDQPPSAVLLECGHAGLCVDCAMHLAARRPGQANCPICRGVVSCVIRLRTDLPVPASQFAQPTPSNASRRRQPGAGSSSSGSAGAHAGAQERLDGSLASGAATGPGSASLHPPAAASLASGARGPPWPSSAKAHAVVVESVFRPPPAGGRTWLSPFIR